jgi:hypothetical protein
MQCLEGSYSVALAVVSLNQRERERKRGSFYGGLSESGVCTGVTGHLIPDREAVDSAKNESVGGIDSWRLTAGEEQGFWMQMSSQRAKGGQPVDVWL